MPAVSEIFDPGLLSERVVLVTGGGTNLGLHAAKELHRAGATVVIAGRREEVLEQARPQIGERCTIASADIREPAGAQAIVDGVLRDHGRLDALVNNAGGQYFVPAAGHRREGLARGVAPERRRHADDDARRRSSAASGTGEGPS